MQYAVFAAPESRLPALLGANVTVTRAITRESVAMMLAADAVVIDGACGHDAWYVLGLLHGQHRQAVLVDRDVTRDELLGMIRDTTRPFAPPLAGVIDSAAIDAHVRTHLERRGILAEADLKHLDLDDLAASVARPALHRFVRELARSGRYPNEQKLQEFLVRRGIFI
ncbi:MAG TPA: hypothetical protein VGD79_03525 [Thermoanaerobaculia bacterium]|jgi:hypothetical protein